MHTYKEYEEIVYNWLMSKHEKDKNFTFSLRQKATKGAEKDFFIGTEKSKYFGTTFWIIPVNFPGSSSDLINLIFKLEDDSYNYYIQFYHTRNPKDDQNRAALELILRIKERVKDNFRGFSQNQVSNKMEYFQVGLSSKFNAIEEMLKEVEIDLNQIIPIVDEEIAKFKQEKPDFIAQRFSINDFNSMQERAKLRIQKYSTLPPSATNNLPEEEEEEAALQNETFPELNQILYGPPGTGKTFNTINKALEIIHSKDKDYVTNRTRKQLVEEFKTLRKTGQIEFITFHQSFSYEDFVEGIKPVLKQGDDQDEDRTINYEIRDGVFKRLCALAKGVTTTVNKDTLPTNFDASTFYKMSLGGKNNPHIHDWCIRNNKLALGWGSDKNYAPLVELVNDWSKFKTKFEELFPEIVKENRYNIQAIRIFLKMKKGDIVLISKGNRIIDAIGIIKDNEYIFENNPNIEYCQFRNIEWIGTDLNASPELFVSKNISQQTIYEFFDSDIKKDYFKKILSKGKDKDQNGNNYVLIIDEINRGNVSSIFGELITLIEPDKRLGNENELTITLPYSGKDATPFGVPSNLYIVGTMNTADRSVEALDTALRRRFCFEEMPPIPYLLSPGYMFWNLLWDYKEIPWEDKEYVKKENQLLGFLGASNKIWETRKDLWEKFKNEGKNPSQALEFPSNEFNGINLETLLRTINFRIEKLLDKDHLIGHSYFLTIKSLADLKHAFINKIIPLLQEYFYGDHGKIGLVLGENFVEIKNTSGKRVFAPFQLYESDIKNDLAQRRVYTIKSPANWETKDFISIYNTNYESSDSNI